MKLQQRGRQKNLELSGKILKYKCLKLGKYIAWVQDSRCVILGFSVLVIKGDCECLEVWEPWWVMWAYNLIHHKGHHLELNLWRSIDKWHHCLFNWKSKVNSYTRRYWSSFWRREAVTKKTENEGKQPVVPCVSVTLLIYPLLLQLSDGVLRFLQALAGRAALLPHHRQLPLDHIVLLCFLCPRHLTLKQQAREGRGSKTHYVVSGEDTIQGNPEGCNIIRLMGTFPDVIWQIFHYFGSVMWS